MNVLLTGGLGYIGSHTAVELLRDENDVIILDNLSNSKLEVLDNIKVITGKKPIFYNVDVTDFFETEKIFMSHKIDAIIHFAAYKSVAESIKKPLDYYRNNVLSTITISQLCHKYNINKFVFSSSASGYGDKLPPLTEDMDFNTAISPYGETKIICEKILRDYANSNKNFNAVFLRYFNPIAADSSYLIGSNNKGDQMNLMDNILLVANKKIDKLIINGGDYNTKDGTCIRDYIHVSDLAIAHKMALYKMKKGVQVYNLGSGRGISILELVNTFSHVNNISIPYEISGRRDGDVESSYSDISKAKRELNWEPKKTVDEMVRDSLEYEKRRKNGHR